MLDDKEIEKRKNKIKKELKKKVYITSVLKKQGLKNIKKILINHVHS